MTIRPAGPEDVAAMAALHADAFAASWPQASIAPLLAGGFAFVVPSEARLSAFVLCRLAVDQAEILTLAVAASMRRLGLARGLVTAACAEARSRGGREMFLEVARSNRAAILLYRKAGFAQVAERPGYYGVAGASDDALVFRRPLGGDIADDL